MLSGIAKLLLHLYRKELEIQISESSIKSMAPKIHVKLRARRQPDFGATLREGHRKVVDQLMIQPKSDLGNRVGKVQLQMRHLIGIL